MKKTHPPVYYTIRTAVRTLVWGGLAFGLLAGTVSLLADDTPSCDITIVSASPALWAPNSDTPVDVSECVAPAYMILNQDGSWDWVSE